MFSVFVICLVIRTLIKKWFVITGAFALITVILTREVISTFSDACILLLARIYIRQFTHHR